MADISVRNTNASAQRTADALLRATGGYQATFLMPPVMGDASDAAQIGVASTPFQEMSIAPATFRRARATMTDGVSAHYELLLSATSVEAQVSAMQIASVDALFGMTAGVQVAGMSFVIENWSASFSLGKAYLYRLLLRVAETELPTLTT